MLGFRIGLKQNSKRRCYHVVMDGCLRISSLVTGKKDMQAGDEYHGNPPHIIVIP